MPELHNNHNRIHWESLGEGEPIAFLNGVLMTVDSWKFQTSWMQRLKRVFSIDIETCPECGGRLKVIACIEDPPLIAKILGHVRRREALIGNAPRSPPALQAELTLT